MSGLERTPTYWLKQLHADLLSLSVTATIPADVVADAKGKSTVAAPTYLEGTLNALSLDLSGSLRVSGAFWQATQPVSLAALTATAFSDANRLPVDARDAFAVTGSVSSAATLFTQDMNGYESLSLQVTANAGANTITFEWSEDQATWFGATYQSVAAGNLGLTAAAATTASSSGILLRFGREARYFRARVSTYNSGTTTVAGSLSKSPVQVQRQPVYINHNSTATCQGVAAHAANISGNPNRLAGRALTANYAAVTTGQTADLVATLVGALVQKPYSIPEADWFYAAAASGILNTNVAVTIAASAGAGLRNYVTGIELMAEALGTATEVAIRDGAAGTVIWRTKIGTGGQALTHIVFPSPIKSSAATLLEVVTLTASGTGAVYFNAHGYIAP